MVILIEFFILIFLIYLLEKNAPLSYVLGLFLFFNIGGYLNSKALGFPGFFTIHDFGLVYAFIAGFKVNNFKIIPKDVYLRKLLRVFLLFTMYQLTVSIIYKLEQPTIFSFFKQLADHRWRLLGIYFIIPTYNMIRKYPKKIFMYILFSSFTILSLYFLTLLTPLSLMNVDYLIREIGEVQGNRIYFYNPSFSLYFIYISFIVILKKQVIENKSLILLSGLMGLITILLTITRQSIIVVSGILLIEFIIVSRIEKLSIPVKSIKIVVFGFIMFMLFVGLFHTTAITLYETFHLSFLELTGKIEAGSTQSRSEFELPVMLARINKYPILGSGFLYDFFWSYHTKWEIGLADVPLLGNIALYGILGFLLYLVRYYLIIKAMYIIKKRYLYFINKLKNYQYYFLIMSISMIIGSILFTFFNFSKEIIDGYGVVSSAMSLGMFYAIFYIMRMKKNEVS